MASFSCTCTRWVFPALKCPRLACQSVILTRGKKKQAKRQTKTKKELAKEEKREYLKKVEADRAYQEAIVKVARKSEPLDPEMLNPARKRPKPKLTEDEEESRILLSKEWSRYCTEKQKREHVALRQMVECRRRALQEVKKISLPLYMNALDLQKNLFPYHCKGPPQTPPLANYEPPDTE